MTESATPWFCLDCSHDFESTQRFPHVRCPNCGSGWLHENKPHHSTVTLEPDHLDTVNLRWDGTDHTGRAVSTTTPTRMTREAAVSWVNAYAEKWGYSITWDGDTATVSGPMTKGPND